MLISGLDPIAKARHAHQVTVAALNVILKRACEAYKEDLAEDNEVQSLVNIFIGSIHEGSFKLYTITWCLYEATIFCP